MAYSFDGVAKRISLSPGTVAVDVADLYSRWKDWALADDNARFELAFRAVGGDPTVSGQYLGVTYFLTNGWRIGPQEADHTLTVAGNLYVDGGGNPFVRTVGAYQVLVVQRVSNLIDQVGGGGGGSFPTAGEIAAAILAAAADTPIWANLKRINDVAVDGAGVPGDEWGPA